MNILKKLLLINIVSLGSLFVPTNLFGAALINILRRGVKVVMCTSPVAAETMPQQSDYDQIINLDTTEPLRAGRLLSRLAFQASVEGKYGRARSYFQEAAQKGDEFAIRFLAQSYKHGGLITGFDGSKYKYYKKMKDHEIDNTHRCFLKSFQKLTNQRLEAAFCSSYPHYNELAECCEHSELRDQRQKNVFICPHLILPQLIEKYLTSDEINQHEDTLARLVTELCADQSYDTITTILGSYIEKQTNISSEKQEKALRLLRTLAEQKKSLDQHFYELNEAARDFSNALLSADEKRYLFSFLLNKFEYCYWLDRELTLKSLGCLLKNSNRLETMHYCAFLKFAYKKDPYFALSYTLDYYSSHLLDLVKLVISNPKEMETFEGTPLSKNQIICAAFSNAKQTTDVEALRYFLLNGAALYEDYKEQIKDVFPHLIHHRYKLFDGILALLRSANDDLKMDCFMILVDKLAALEAVSSDSDRWVDQLFSQDLPSINGNKTRSYYYCYKQFTEKKATRALQLLEIHFPEELKNHE